MPILAAEPTVYPADLFSMTADLASEDCWWALHTKPRAEKALARRLLAKGISFFLPVHEPRYGLSPGRLTARVPLFPGYLFLRGSQEARFGAIETGFVANCLEVVDQDELAANLRDIHRLIESGGPVVRESSPAKGTQVRIIKGPLTGVYGTVVRSGSSLKFLVEVKFLQSGASVEVDASMVEQA